ncbi:MAG TPA: acyltransferase, partial [Tetrasphaera sp.]|uniref:acyltransferase family protein n=1 Tax=Nostocoides sp. TaxID=1917966 RepID=UPI002D0626DA
MSQVIVTPSSASAVATVQAPAATSAVVPSRAASAARLAGLDGLRTIAIAAVVIFHLNPAWLPGGFLGVDIFFVVSGFLITTLLVREQARTGTVDFAGFWGRRARRLLPALLLCLPLSIVLARLVQTDLLVGIGREVLGALTFSYNWVQIAAGADYFASTTPQLFTNLWSLAVEEQFYLVWPLTTWLLLRHVPSVRARIAVPLTLGVASALWMGVHFDPDLGATRVYYGTDTHVVGLMLGAALAFWFAGPGRATLAGPRWAAIRRPAPWSSSPARSGSCPSPSAARPRRTLASRARGLGTARPTESASCPAGPTGPARSGGARRRRSAAGSCSPAGAPRARPCSGATRGASS